jgi:parallel beta-helix repeat protein
MLILLAAPFLATIPSIRPAGAQVSNIACGQTITNDTVLTADLGPCPNYGLILGADNITLDLNGHRIFGTPSPFDNAGALVRGRTGTTVKNGRITDFDGGVVIEGGSNNTVTGIDAENNIGVQVSTGSTLYGDGILIESSQNNVISDNRTVNNGPFSGIGVVTAVDSDHPRSTTGVSSGNLIDSNQVVGNVVGRGGTVGPSTDNDGIRIEPGSSANVITNNQVSGNGLDGIAIFARSPDNVIRNNQVSRNGFFRTTARRGDGIIVFNLSDRTVVEGNLTSGNADNGIRIRGPLGATAGSVDNRIVGNESVGNAVLPTIPSGAFGSAAYDLNDQNPNCDNNLWSANRYHTANPPCTTAGGQQV